MSAIREITSAELGALKVGKSTYSALDIENKQLEALNQDEGKLRWCRDFIEKNRVKLAGLYWDIGYGRTSVSIACSDYYCGVSAKEIAARWPDAKWKRVKADGVCMSDEDKLFTRNWKAKIDGLDVEIVGAERLEPVTLPKLGEEIELT